MQFDLDLSKRLLFGHSSLFKKRFRNFEAILWLTPFFLVILAGLLIASTQRQTNYADWYNHWITACIGFALAFLIAQIPVERIKPFILPSYLITISSLFFVRVVGVSALGAQRWINIGGLNFQPSEFAKISAILVLASILERNRIKKPSNLLKPISVILLPWILVFFQPDLGTSLVFGAFLFAMLYWSGMPIEWGLLPLSALITAIFSGVFKIGLFIWIPCMGFLAYRSFPSRRLAALVTTFLQSVMALITPWLWTNVLKGYQRDRLVLFLDPAKDPLGGGYHLLQSKVGIGSGGWFGTGLLQGQLTKLSFIPEQHTDFIFSALGEELGFLGTSIVIMSFFLLILRLLNIARSARSDFESLLVIGVGSMIMFQVVVNIFMTIGLGPVTGIPLPFLSYGRSALLVNFVSLGLCISVARRALFASRSW